MSEAEAGKLKAYSFKPIVDQCLTATTDLLPIRDAALRGRSDEARAAAEAYVAWCLDEATLVDTSDVTPGEVAEVRKNLVALVSPLSDDVWCHGFRIDNFVLTALHCTRIDDRPIRLSARTIEDKTLFATTEVYPNDGGAIRVATSQSQDYALLRIEPGFPTPDPRGLDWLGDPRELERLVVLQSNVYVRQVLALGNENDLIHSLRLEHNPACRLIAATPEGYLLHSCATERGTSGVPIFQRGEGGRLRLVGVHAGATKGLRTSPQWQACKARAENYAVRPSRAKIAAAMGRRDN